MLRYLLILLALSLNASGQMVRRWMRQYNDPANGHDGAVEVRIDRRGDVIVTGRTQPAINNFDYHTIKYAAGNGVVAWERSARPSGTNDWPAGLAVDRDGNIIVSGYSDDGSIGYYTVKYAADNGALIWDKNVTGPPAYSIYATGVAVDNAGDVFVTGAIREDDYYDMYTVKSSATDGRILWEKYYDGPAARDDSPSAIAVDGDGNVVVGGRSTSIGTGYDCCTLKYAGVDGRVLWERRHNGPGNYSDYISAIALESSGNVIAVGTSNGTSPNGDQFYRAKYAAADGALLWERIDGAREQDHALGVTLAADGDIVVSGYTRPPSSFGTMTYLTEKLAAATGVPRWGMIRQGSGDLGASGNGAAVSPGGNVFAAGNSSVPGTVPDVLMVEYEGTDGTVLWQDVFNGPASLDDSIGSGTAVVATLDGGFVVCGQARGANANFFTMYYSRPPTPLETWRHTFFGTLANAGNAADAADPDNDNLVNLIEWACGLDPTIGSPMPGTPVRDVEALVFRYRRSTDAVNAGTVFTVEWSDTLAGDDWQTDAVKETIISGDAATQHVDASLPSAARRFARLRISAPP